MAIGTPLGIGQAGLVDAGITDQTIDGFGATPLLQPLTEFSHRIEGVELAVHGGESIERPVVNLGHGIHLVNITNGTNDVITVGGQEGLGRLPAKTRRTACDDHKFCWYNNIASDDILETMRRMREMGRIDE